jgi:hypothetical protein
MSDDSSSLLEEERSLFRPFTRESLLAIEARIADELEKQKELEKRRAEGEVRAELYSNFFPIEKFNEFLHNRKEFFLLIHT